MKDPRTGMVLLGKKFAQPLFGTRAQPCQADVTPEAAWRAPLTPCECNAGTSQFPLMLIHNTEAEADAYVGLRGQITAVAHNNMSIDELRVHDGISPGGSKFGQLVVNQKPADDAYEHANPEAYGNFAMTLGVNSYVDGDGAIAIGYQAFAQASGSVCVGQNSTAGSPDESTAFSTAVGYSSIAQTGAAIGAQAAASDFGTAVGVMAEARRAFVNDGPAERGVAIGYNAKAFRDRDVSIGDTANSTNGGGHNTLIGAATRAEAGAKRAVAIGSEAVVYQDDTVSVGSTQLRRRVVNVADGTDVHDVATLGQLNGRLSVAQRAAINAVTAIADPATATAANVAAKFNALLAALKA